MLVNSTVSADNLIKKNPYLWPFPVAEPIWFPGRLWQQWTMAACSRYSLYWEETDCLSYYDTLSLHEIFEIVGSQLTETDVEVLSFLLDEAYPARHPLDPETWTEDASPDSDAPVNSPCPCLVEAWRRICPKGEPGPFGGLCKPKSGVALLLEMERRGFLSEANLEPLLQLLRVLTRHDLLPFVSSKKRRTGKQWTNHTFEAAVLIIKFRLL